MTIIARFGATKLPTLVLLHGFLGSKEDWLSLMPLLSQHFHCICIDLPAHGQHALPREAQNLDDLAWALLERLRALKLTHFHLLGYSLGGRLALHMARQLAQSATPKTMDLLSLTLVSTHPGLADDRARRARKLEDSQWLTRLNSLPYEAFLTLWYQQAVFSSLAATAKVELVAWRSKQLNLKLKSELSAGLSLMSLASQQDCWQVPQLLDCPCQVFVGALDDKFTLLAKAWLALAPIKLRVFDDAGHTLHTSQPQVFSDALIHSLLPMKGGKRVNCQPKLR